MDERNSLINRLTKNENSTNHVDNKINGKKESNEGERIRTVYIVFFSLLFDLLAFTMILPLFPSLLDFYRTNDKSGVYDALSNSVRYFQELSGAPEEYNNVLFGGFLGSIFSFLQFVISPIVGGLSDVYGRKPLLLICSLGVSLSYLLWAFSINFGIFILARIVGGLSRGNISLSMAIIADVSDGNTRGKGMALVGIAFSLGFLIGPMIGAIFSVYSDKSTNVWFWLPAMFAMFLSVVNFLFIALCFKESLPVAQRVKRVSSSLSYAMDFVRVNSIFNFAAVKNISNSHMETLKKLGFIYFIYLFIYSGLEFTVTFLMHHRFNFTSFDQAKMFLTTGIIMALLQGSVVRRLPSTLVKGSTVFGLYLIVPAFILVGLATNSVVLYSGMILFAISTAFVVTCMTTMVSKYGNSDQKGAVLGIFRSLGALARAGGPIVGSMAFWGLGSSFTYILGGIFLLYPAVLLHRLEIA